VTLRAMTKSTLGRRELHGGISATKYDIGNTANDGGRTSPLLLLAFLRIDCMALPMAGASGQRCLVGRSGPCVGQWDIQYCARYTCIRGCGVLALGKGDETYRFCAN
jgi:hypothetical protein